MSLVERLHNICKTNALLPQQDKQVINQVCRLADQRLTIAGCSRERDFDTLLTHFLCDTLRAGICKLHGVTAIGSFIDPRTNQTFELAKKSKACTLNTLIKATG